MVNDNDPVPRLLHDLQCTTRAVKYAAEAEKIIKKATDIVRVVGILGDTVSMFTSQGTWVGLIPKAALLYTSTTGSGFHAIGQYVFLTEKKVEGRRSSDPAVVIDPQVVQATSKKMKDYMTRVELDDASLCQHRLRNYGRSLLAANLLRKWQTGDSTYPPPAFVANADTGSPKRMIVVQSSPVVRTYRLISFQSFLNGLKMTAVSFSLRN